MKKNKPLYDHATDSLSGLTRTEHEMIDQLASSPPSRTIKILDRYYKNAKSKKLFFSRTAEIFLCYYKWGAHNMNPFSFNQGIVSQVIDHLDLLKTKVHGNKKRKDENQLGGNSSKTFTRKSDDNVKTSLKLETLIKPFSKWNKLRKILVDEEVLKKDYSLNIKGHGWKKRTIFLINELENKRYIDIRLSSRQVEAIIKHSFKESIGRRYVDLVNSSGEKTDEFKFIPDSSQIS